MGIRTQFGEEMEHRNEEACDECKRNCLLNHGKRVSSFFKVMIEKNFSKLLYFPPKFARSVSHLIDQETYLEDSSGQRWRVTICDHNGALAIRHGWSKFSSEHGLNLGDFLVFHYVQGQHFIVQIFGASACEKIKFYNDIGKGKKRARIYPEATSQDELLQTNDISSVKKKSKTSAVSQSEKVALKPHRTNFATNTDADAGKGQLVRFPVSVDEAFCIIDRDAQYDQGDDRLCLHLSSFETPASKPLVENSSFSSKGDSGNSDHVNGSSRGIISSSFLKPAENDNKSDDISNATKYRNPWMSTFDASSRMVLRSDNKEGRCTGINQNTREKSKEASLFARGTRLVKQEFEETASEAYCLPRVINGSGEEPANGNEKVIKSEPADSGDMPSLNAVSYSCSVEVDGRDFLVLPESWRNYLTKRAKLGKRMIYLRGVDKRIWPTLYQRRCGVDVLTCGWKEFTAGCGLNRGDVCLLLLDNLRECIFDACKILK